MLLLTFKAFVTVQSFFLNQVHAMIRVNYSQISKRTRQAYQLILIGSKVSHLVKHEELLYRAASREASFERRPPKISSWKADEAADATNASQKNASL